MPETISRSLKPFNGGYIKKAIGLMEDTSKSLFITGKVGTGKPTLLDCFCDNTKKKPIVLAPTGVVALHVQRPNHPPLF